MSSPVPLFSIVALPVLLTSPEMFIAPALFVMFALPTLVTLPSMLKPPAPVFNISKPSASMLPVAVTLNPPEPLFVIFRLPVLFVIFPDTFRTVPSFKTVALPVFVKVPPIFIAPALFVSWAVPLLVTEPFTVKPSAPVFNIVKPVVFIAPVVPTLSPPAAWFVIVVLPAVLLIVPVMLRASIDAFRSVARSVFPSIPFNKLKSPVWLIVPEIFVPLVPVLFIVNSPFVLMFPLIFKPELTSDVNV